MVSHTGKLYSLKDSLATRELMQRLQERYSEKGFFLYRWDTLQTTSETLKLQFNPGKQFRHGRLVLDESTSALIADQMLSEIDSGTILSPKRISRLSESLLGYFENRGRPFAVVQWVPLRIQDEIIDLQFILHPGPVIRWDSIQYHGEAVFHPDFANKVFGTNPGQLYNESSLAFIQQFVRQSSYLQLTQPLSVEFVDNKARLHVHIKRRRGNEISGLLGILPNAEQPGAVLLTGEVKAQLSNLFKRNKELNVHWNRLQTQTQSFFLSYHHYNLLGSPLGVSGALDLLRQDTSFLTVSRKLSVSWDNPTFGKFGVYSDQLTSGVLGNAQVAVNDQSGWAEDYRWTRFGASFQRNVLDNDQFPKKGWFMRVQGDFGTKILEDSLTSSGENFRSVQWSYSGAFQVYTPLHPRWVLSVGGQVEQVQNEQVLFINDALRLGGFGSIRGFNENEFYATQYQQLKSEIRFFADSEFIFFAFWDQAFLRLITTQQNLSDQPTGVGLGLAFSSGNGIFQFTYSLGRSQNQTFAFNLSKVHFGLQSKF